MDYILIIDYMVMIFIVLFSSFIIALRDMARKFSLDFRKYVYFKLF